MSKDATVGGPYPSGLTDDQSRSVVLPKRRVVERTFGWVGPCRRNSKDYEELPDGGQSMVSVAMIGPMLRRRRPAG